MHPSFSAILVTTTTTTAVICYALWTQTSGFRKRRAIQNAPRDLDTWRQPGPSVEACENVWREVEQVFRDHGYTLWTHYFDFVLKGPKSYPSASGFAYALPSRGISDAIGSVSDLLRFECWTPLNRAIRTPDGRDAIVRVIKIGNEGREHLNILRKIATSPHALISSNHTLPLWNQFELGHITFGVFPLVGGSMRDAWNGWPKNSVGDIMNMLMQALEGLAFIHTLNIAHRDAFHTNFVVEWHPESLLTLTISPSRPRVYLIDFEVAIQFPDDSLPEDRVCVGLPLGGSFPEEHMYAAPRAPETLTGTSYSPFKLDVWQLGTSFLNYKTNIPQLDAFLVELRCPDSQSRLSAQDALTKLTSIINGMPPVSLLVAGETS